MEETLLYKVSDNLRKSINPIEISIVFLRGDFNMHIPFSVGLSGYLTRCSAFVEPWFHEISWTGPSRQFDTSISLVIRRVVAEPNVDGILFRCTGFSTFQLSSITKSCRAINWTELFFTRTSPRLRGSSSMAVSLVFGRSWLVGLSLFLLAI